MKTLAVIAVMVFGTAAMSYAQNSATPSVTLASTVIQGISTSVSGEDNFGTIVAGTTPSALNATSGTVGMASGDIAEVTVTGNGASILTVTFSTSSLTGTGAAIAYTPSVYGSSSPSGQSGSASVTSGGTVTLSGTTGSTGNYYFWVGGSLSALPNNQAPGSYAGTWTMTVNY